LENRKRRDYLPHRTANDSLQSTLKKVYIVAWFASHG